MTVKWLWRTGDGAQVETVLMRSAEPGDGLRLVAGRLRDGLHVLRDRPGRLRAPPRRGGDRRAGRARPSTSRRARVSHVVFMGMGEPLANVEPVLGRARAAARRLRPLGPAPHGVDRRRRARHAPPRAASAPRHARGLAPRARRRAARHARAAQPPLPDQLGPRRRRASTPRSRAGGSPSSTPASRASTTSPSRPRCSPAA